MAEFNEKNFQSNDVVSGVEPVRKHSVAKTAGIVTASALVVAVGGGVAAYSLSDFVKNQVKLRFSTPESYYAWVTEKNSSEIASTIADSYRAAIEKQKNGQHSQLSLTYELSDELKKMLAEDIPEDETDTLNAINNLKDITLGVDAYQKGESMSGNIYTKFNDEEIVSLDTAVDLRAEELFFRIPALSEQWIIAPDVITMDYDEVGEKFVSDPESIITPDELESLITKYSELYSSLLSDIQIEKKEEVAVGDITVNYTVAEVTLDKQVQSEMAEKFSAAMKEDELLKSIIVDRLGAVTAEEYDSELDSMTENIKNSNNSYSETIKTYIDANGDIRGIAIDEESNGTDDIKFVVGKDGSATRAELVAIDDGEEVFRTDFALNELGGAYSGKLNYISDGEDIKVNFRNVTIIGDNKYLNADVEITFLDYDDEEQSISLSLKSDGSSQKISSDIIIEDTNYGTLTAEFSTENGAEPVIPDSSGAYDVSSDDADFPKDFVDQEKMTEFIKNIYIKLGLGEKEAQEYAQMMTESMYRSYDYMMDFDYPEINGWDADEDEFYDFDDEDLDFDEDDFDLFWEEWENMDEDDRMEYFGSSDDFDISDFDISFDRIGDDNMAVG